MSRRPKIHSRRERVFERGVQRARRDRNAALEAATQRTPEPPPELLEPYITCVGRGKPSSPIPKAVQAWIAEESAQQLRHYRRIAREMDALAPQRDAWVAQFFARITGPRGFSVHAGLRRTIPAGDLPDRPARHWRVVW